MSNLYELVNVSKVYKNEGKEFEALKDINLSIKEGEIFGIIGMSGAGKSTLVRTLNRLEEVSEGRVEFEGRNLKDLSRKDLRKLRQKISMIFQGFNLLNQRTVIKNVEQPLRIAGINKSERRQIARNMLKVVELSDKEKAFPQRLSGGQKQRVAIARALASDPQSFNLLNQRTVIKNVEQPLRIAGINKSERRQIARNMLKVVELSDKEKAFPQRLSGGQKQRVAIARALASDPKVLLCDEATSALDPKITNEILDLLKTINDERKLTIVIITHEMSVIEKICDRVAIIDEGRLAEIGDVKEVFRNPKSAAAKKLVFPANPFSPSDSKGRLARIVFDGTKASVPFIADLVEKTGQKVNILSANTKSVGGIGYGQMVIELPAEEENQRIIKEFFTNGGLTITEVN